MAPFSRFRLFDADRLHERRAPPDIPPKAGVANANVTLRPVSLLIAGDLTPQSAAADLLECAIFLTETTPWRPLDIEWIGDGVLSRLLKAQTLPDALHQRFHGTLPLRELVDRLGHADILCLSGPVGDLVQPLTLSRWAGLPVIGCSDDKDLVAMLRHRQAGWTFDRNNPISIMAALSHALAVHAVAYGRQAAAAGVVEIGTGA